MSHFTPPTAYSAVPLPKEATSSFAAPSAHKMIAASEVCDFYGISHSTLWRWVKDGQLPAPMRIGRRIFWNAPMLEEHVANLRADGGRHE